MDHERKFTHYYVELIHDNVFSTYDSTLDLHLVDPPADTMIWHILNDCTAFEHPTAYNFQAQQTFLNPPESGYIIFNQEDDDEDLPKVIMLFPCEECRRRDAVAQRFYRIYGSMKPIMPGEPAAIPNLLFVGTLEDVLNSI